MSEARFSAHEDLAELRQFQRATVEQVCDVFYRRRSGRRYLVSDETGLGKSMVARGVIAKAIEHLQQDSTVQRIDVVYICSNTDVARQNIKRLNVIGNEVNLTTRLTMLATASHQLSTPVPSVGKPVNLISLTPQTSFPDKGWRTGIVEERALLYLLLRNLLDLKRARATAAYRILQGTVSSWERFKEQAERFEEDRRHSAKLNGTPLLDPVIVDEFAKHVRVQSQESGASPLAAFEELVEATKKKGDVPGGRPAADAVVVELRRALARAGVAALQPDLVVLDEFQRFTDLLKRDQPISELAHLMFDHPAARVLLLSATPYKPFDLDANDGRGDDSGTHRSQFMETLTFLTEGLADNADSAQANGISKLLDEFRRALAGGQDPSEIRDSLRGELLGVMCRTERPPTVVDSMVEERRLPAASVGSDDVAQFIGLTDLANHLETRLPMDVWKSVPSVVHFMDAYQLGRFAAERIGEPSTYERVEALARLDPQAVDVFEELPRQNPRLDTLVSATTGTGWEKLLWVPPSVPYLKPGGPYANPELLRMTKKLVFSQWSATPTAVASLLSHDASRRIARSETASSRSVTTHDLPAPRLQFRRRGTDPSAMASFMLFFPFPGLADETDPLRLAGASGRHYDPEYAELRFAGELRGRLPADVEETGAADVASLSWEWPLMISDAQLDLALSGRVAGMSPADAVAARVFDPKAPGGAAGETSSVLDEYVQAAIQVHRTQRDKVLDRIPRDLTLHTARLALHSPANCAWRAFGRLDGDMSEVTIGGRWRAAAILAGGLRTLFNRWESALILDDLYRDDAPYWQKVLRYCKDGNLQAVLDEYLFHLGSVEGETAHTDESLVKFANEAAKALKLSPATYKAKDPLGEGNDIDFRCRFALRYGDAKHDDQSVRPTDIREAFNSPFWPFVLVSTSVGQEGIDFHPWCHNLVHWNVPSSPVDFEQRDGRVNRFRGHAVRRNIAARHSAKMLAAGNPWKAAYDLAKTDAPHSEIGGLAPDWVYPGPFKVYRDVMPYQLSIDEARIARAKKRVAYYRLAFGQTRQEDLIAVVEAAGVEESDAERWRVDLRP